MNPRLCIDQLACIHDETPLFDEISFSLKPGELCALLGPSGCGKTTLLRAIAGLQSLSAGSIALDGRDISNLRTEKRGIGMVFQDYALFPHMTIAANIGFGLKDRKTRKARIQEMLSLVGLDGLNNRYPYQLSGGQQQRVALARALANRPQLLLLDEPFSSLDTELRQSLCQRVRDILKTAQVTAIMVTHDQTEAFTFADCIGLMSKGKLQQFSNSHDLYYHPRNKIVANFIGQSQFIAATIDHAGNMSTALGFIGSCNDASPGQVSLLTRPENWQLDQTGRGAEVSVADKIFYGAETHYQLNHPNLPSPITVRLPNDDFSIGDKLHIKANFKYIAYFE